MPVKEDRIRLQWLDIAKGITIILMVMGHSAIPDVLGRFIFAFHMPLFFIASGITTKYSSFSEFIRKKSKGLLLPFIIYSVIVLVLEANLLRISIAEEFGNWMKMGWLGMALWFVPVLFLSLFVCWCINKISNKWARIIAICVVIAIGILLNKYRIWLPWNVATVPYAAFYILIGNWFRPYCGIIDKLYNKWYAYVALLIATLLISHFWRLDMAWNKCTPIIPLTIGALCGSLLFFCISKYIEKKCSIITRLFTSIGKETFVILSFSQITIRYLNEYFAMPFYVKYSILVIVLMLIVSLKSICINGLKKCDGKKHSSS